MQEDKAVSACREYVAANKEIKRLTKLIGDCLSMCKGIHGSLGSINMRGDDSTHLHICYRNRNNGRTSNDILDQCEYCKTANRLIQFRKQARQRLGKAKRAITMIGKGGAE